MSRAVPLSTIRSFSLYTQQWYMSHRFADSLRAGSGRNQFRPDPARNLSTSLCDIHHCYLYSGKLLMMDRGTVRDMQSFYFKNKFEKLVHLVGFIHPKVIPALTQWWGLCCHMILRAMLAVAYVTGRASHARQVRGDDPDEKGYPGSTGWRLGVGLTTPHRKYILFRSITLSLGRMRNDC